MQKDEIIYDVLGIGNAIVDVLAKVGDGFLTERGLNKGSMTLLGAREAGEIYRDIIPEGEVSGGSAQIQLPVWLRWGRIVLLSARCMTMNWDRFSNVRWLRRESIILRNRCLKGRRQGAALFW